MTLDGQLALFDPPATPARAARPAHLCHADGCTAAVPPRLLMCARHWRMVPRALQRERRKELRDAGLVEATGDRRPAPSGALATVWRAVPNPPQEATR